MNSDDLRRKINSMFFIENAAWEDFFQSCKQESVTKNQWFIQEGQTCRKIGFIVQGAMRIYLSSEGKEFTKEFLFESDLVGYSGDFLNRTPSQLYIQAIEDTLILTVSYDQFIALNKQHESWREFRRFSAEQLFIAKSKREISLIKNTPDERYQELLTTRPHVIQRIPLGLIASYLGITQETLSRVRKRLL